MSILRLVGLHPKKIWVKWGLFLAVELINRCMYAESVAIVARLSWGSAQNVERLGRLRRSRGLVKRRKRGQ